MDTDVRSPGPIFTAHLFPTLDGKLLELLRSLTPAEWRAQTIAGGWTVHDVTAHLLDTVLRRLSICRDNYVPEASGPGPGEGLVTFINRLNAAGVAVYGRLSPPILIEMMEVATRAHSHYQQSLDPYAPAQFAVSWAGEQRSLNWFDTARELTERWHHQQQIRLAVGKSGIETPDLYHPVLDCFMRALPFAYRTVFRPVGTVARVTVPGPCGGDWYLVRTNTEWSLVTTPADSPAAEIVIPEGIAWRIFTKGMSRDAAKDQIHISGDAALALHVLTMVSIVG